MWPLPRLTLWFKRTRFVSERLSWWLSGVRGVGGLPHVHNTHKSTHTHANAGSSQMKVFPWLGWGGRGEGAGWENTAGRPPLARTAPFPTLLPRSQFGGHEVDVRLDEGEEGQAPLELRHVLNQRGLETWRKNRRRGAITGTIFALCFSVLYWDVNPHSFSKQINECEPSTAVGSFRLQL